MSLSAEEATSPSGPDAVAATAAWTWSAPVETPSVDAAEAAASDCAAADWTVEGVCDESGTEGMDDAPPAEVERPEPSTAEEPSAGVRSVEPDVPLELPRPKAVDPATAEEPSAGVTPPGLASAREASGLEPVDRERAWSPAAPTATVAGVEAAGAVAACAAANPAVG
jgi:hypothetical protein